MRKRPRRRRWLRLAGRASALGAAFLLFSAFWGIVEFEWSKDRYPSVRYPAPLYRPEVTWVEDPPPGWVSLSEVPRATWLAVLANEDAGFFRHDGLELKLAWARIVKHLRLGRRPGGVSTLNQQLAKNLYFGARAAWLRKLPEAVVAQWMDDRLEKKQLLELYLNIAEWGPDVVGIGAAARFYFHKPASRLTERESALLANLLPNPRVIGAAAHKGRISPRLAREINRTLRRLRSTDRVVREQIRERERERERTRTDVAGDTRAKINR